MDWEFSGMERGFSLICSQNILCLLERSNRLMDVGTPTKVNFQKYVKGGRRI